MTFSLDQATADRLDQVAGALRMPKSRVVRDAILEYAERAGRLTDVERLRLLTAFDQFVPAIPDRPGRDVDAELAELRRARRGGGRGGAPAAAPLGEATP